MSNYVDLPVEDRMKTFLFNEEMADVHFSVGFGGVKTIPAYKVLLATASEVFHGQLYGRFDVPEVIDVTDMTPETFKTVLGYIYTDEVDLTPDNALPVLYLAKKYLLNNLVAQVAKYVTTAYTSESIAKVLPHLYLVDGEIAESHANLCDILRRDLSVDELTVYNSALAWTQEECARKQLCFETDARAVLGEALKLIRFPLMHIKEFSSGPAKSSFLTDQEKLEIYRWYGLHASDELTTFSSDHRKRPMLSCNRFDAASIVNDGEWPNEEGVCFFNFSVNAHIRVYGVAFFGQKDESNVIVSLHNADSGETLATTHTRKPIAPGKKYKITAVSIGPNSMYAQNGQREVTYEDGGSSVTFSFTDTGLQGNDQYDVSLHGHIPVIYFSFS